MFWKAKKSHSTPAQVGLVDGQLMACGQKPNCVSSSADPKSDFYIAPLQSNNIEVIWDNLNILLGDMGYKIVAGRSDYIHATATSSLMKFVDDMEFLLDKEEGKIHLRSLSRVGYSDLGANRKRINEIKKRLKDF